MRSILLRAFILVVPIFAGFAVTVWLSRLFPRPEGPSTIAWWSAISLAALVTLYAAERAMRRLGPLAVLLKLSLAFPDHAPSRFAVARKSANLRKLKEELDRARDEGRDDDLTRASENILALAAALSAHDRRTRGHSERVRVFTDMLADEMHLPEDDRQRLRWAALLHDIGKLRVPAKVLNKESALSGSEWAQIHRHPEEGVAVAAPLVPWLGDAADAIRQHHERYDGGGYPKGLAGERITLGARIVSVADAYDTITTGRPYQKPLSPSAARRELAEHAGGQFDPKVVRALLNLSIGRLWWRVGIMSWLSQLPLLGTLPRAAQRFELALQSAGFAGRTAAALTAAGLAAAPLAQVAGTRAEASVPGPKPPAIVAEATVRARPARLTPHPSPAPRPSPAPEPAPPEGSPPPVAAPSVPAPPVPGAPAPSPPPPAEAAPQPAPAPRSDPVEDLVQAVEEAVESITDAVGAAVPPVP